MIADDIDSVIDGMLDELASIEHERWSHWQRYVHSRGTLQQDGSLVISASLVRQWNSQLEKPFSALTEKEKDSDREQVRRYTPLIAARLKAML